MMTHDTMSDPSRDATDGSEGDGGGRARGQAVTSAVVRMSGKAPAKSLQSAALAVVIR